jgi:tRNA uridine 5-carboxymethylaminomethyl modification enzyme
MPKYNNDYPFSYALSTDGFGCSLRYIEKERNNANKLTRLEDVKIPEFFDYDKIKSMSIEAKQKLSAIRPVTISQASRISGVSPSDISVLLIYMGR